MDDKTTIIHYCKASMTLPDGMSLNDLQDALRSAVREKLGSGADDYVYVSEIYAERLVACKCGDEYEHFMMTWSIDQERKVTLGDANRVVEVRQFIPMSKAAERWQPEGGLFDGIVL